MGMKANPWRDGNGPAREAPDQEGAEQPEAQWQEPIAQGQRPAGTSRKDTGHEDQGVSGQEAGDLGDMEYQPSANQVKHQPMPASHHADRRDENAVDGHGDPQE
jgi:hypothetical protein